MLTRKASLLVLISVFLADLALGSEAIPNWPAPATWTPSRAVGPHTLTDITYPAIFVGVTPCRIADTRGNGFIGAYGPPSLGANTTRTFVITGVCGIPAFAAAVSFNFGALNVGGQGDLRVFPAGGSTPLVSTMNYNANTPNIANAAVVPLGTAGGITVQADAVSVDLIIDVNGYYLDPNGRFTSGEFVGFRGTVGGGGVVFATNDSISTSETTSAVRGELLGDGNSGAAILGQQFGTGANFGVRGELLASQTTGNSAGVLGVAGGRTGTLSYVRAGVRGESATDYGILGITNLNDFSSAAIWGAVIDTSGATPYVGALGLGNSTPSAALGVLFYGGLGGSGTKSFYEPHPTDPEKVIRYVSLEGPEAGTYFRGTAHVVHGQAVIVVPEDFRIVTDDEGLTVQLTPVGSSANMWIASEDLNQITVRSSKDVTFHYLVQGVRRNYKNFEVVAKSPFFQPRSPSDRMIPSLSDGEKARLIANGTYNADGTVNMRTAERIGWAKAWRDREGQPKAAAAANAAAHAAWLAETK